MDGALLTIHPMDLFELSKDLIPRYLRRIKSKADIQNSIRHAYIQYF